MRLAPLAAALLLLAACEVRPPYNRGQAVGIADAHQRHLGVNWGDPVEVVPPGVPDLQGRRWWTVRYADGAGSELRAIQVDAASGWAKRFP